MSEMTYFVWSGTKKLNSVNQSTRASLVYDLLVRSSAELWARIKRKFWSRDLTPNIFISNCAQYWQSTVYGAVSPPTTIWYAV